MYYSTFNIEKIRENLKKNVLNSCSLIIVFTYKGARYNSEN